LEEEIEKDDPYEYGYLNEVVQQNIRTILRAQYEETQAHLKEQGITELMVFRGMRLPSVKKSLECQGTDIQVDHQPLNSYSTDFQIAIDFAGTEPQSVVLTSVIPASDVIGMPGHGMGCLGEKELVVRNGMRNVTGFSPNPHEELRRLQTTHEFLDDALLGAKHIDDWRAGVEKEQQKGTGNG